MSRSEHVVNELDEIARWGIIVLVATRSGGCHAAYTQTGPPMDTHPSHRLFQPGDPRSRRDPHDLERDHVIS